MDHRPNMMEIIDKAKSNFCRQDDALDVEMGYTNHEDVIQTIFIKDDIASIVEVERSVTIETINKCPSLSPNEEAEIFHVTMLALRIHPKTIPKEEEIYPRKLTRPCKCPGKRKGLASQRCLGNQIGLKKSHRALEGQGDDGF